MFPPICEKQIILLDSSSVFFKKKLMPTVSSGRSLILKVIIIAHNQRDKNCAILCLEGEKAPNL